MICRTTFVHFVSVNKSKKTANILRSKGLFFLKDVHHYHESFDVSSILEVTFRNGLIIYIEHDSADFEELLIKAGNEDRLGYLQN